MKLVSCLLTTLGLVLAGIAPLTAQTTVSITATDDEAAETAPGQPANPANIRVTRTGGTTAALTVWVKVGGTALQGVDYTFANTIGSFVIIPAGSASLNIPITPRDDAFTEASEEIRIDLEEETSAGTPVPYVIGDDRAEVALLDNEDPTIPPRAVVSVQTFGSQALEVFSNSVTFRITREQNLSVPIDVRYALGGTATVGEDYAAPPETIAIPAGTTFVDVNIVAINDPLVETPETITFTLLPHPNIGDVPPPPEAYALGFVTGGSLTIVSEDLPPPPVVTITSPISGSSQPAPGTIEVAFDAVDPVGYIFGYVLTDGSTVLASNRTFLPTTTAPGTPFDFSLTLTNVRAGLHVFRAKVWSSTGVMGTTPSVQSIVTNIPPIISYMSVTALDAEAAEGLVEGEPNSAVFAITVDRPMPSNQYVVYRLSSPGPGFDFSPPDTNYSNANWPMFWPIGPTDYGYAYFPSGSTRVEIVVRPVDDAINEGTENLTLTLSYPFVFTEQSFEGIVQFTEGGFHQPPFDPFALPVRYFDYDLTTNVTATATILDNDTEPTPFAIVSITATDADAEETAPSQGAPNVGVFTIARVGPTNLPLVVNYTISTIPRRYPLTFPAPVQAVNGVDYETIPTSSITIPEGATSADIVISPVHDLVLEANEYVQITLRPSLMAIPSPLSYLLYTNSLATIVIKDLPLAAFTPVVRIKAIDARAYEAAVISPTARFEIVRSGSLAGTLVVPLTIGGTAINGLDYVRITNFATFPPGVRYHNITITPYIDQETEPNELVSITINPPPANVTPPPYVLGGVGPMFSTAAAHIVEDGPPSVPLSQLSRGERARRLRFPGRYRIVMPPLLPTNAVPAAVAPTWSVEASSDLVDWVELGVTQDQDEFLDVSAEGEAQRFYRFRELPPVEP